MELFVSTTASARATAPLSFAPFRRGRSPSVVAPLRRRLPARGWRTSSAAVPDPVPSEEPASASASSTVVVTDKPDSPAVEKVAEESSASSASITDKPDSPAGEKIAEESSASSASVEATVVAPASSDASVEDGGLDDILSKEQLSTLLSLLQTIQLDEDHDTRVMTSTGKDYTVRDAYKELTKVDIIDDNASYIWASDVPNKVKIFSWLFFNGRLNTRASLHYKNIIESAACERCACTSEDQLHLFFACQPSDLLWSQLGLRPYCDGNFNDLWRLPLPPCLRPHRKVWLSILQVILWRLWDGRNKHVFEGKAFYSRRVINNIVSDLEIWCHRFHDKTSVVAWTSYLKHCIT